MYVGRHRKPPPPRRPVTGVGFVAGATAAATISVVVTATTPGQHPVALTAALPAAAPVTLQLPPLDVATAALYLTPLTPAVESIPVERAAVRPVTVKAAGTTGGLAARAVSAALAMRGVPYVWGGSSRSGVDCSGLTQLAFRAAGTNLPRVAAAQATVGKSVPLSQVQAGDLIFYDYGGGISHVVMSIGGGRIVEASEPGVPVHSAPLYTKGLAAVRRII